MTANDENDADDDGTDVNDYDYADDGGAVDVGHLVCGLWVSHFLG